MLDIREDSCVSFKPVLLNMEKLDALLNSARHSPTVQHSHGVTWSRLLVQHTLIFSLSVGPLHGRVPVSTNIQRYYSLYYFSININVG